MKLVTFIKSLVFFFSFLRHLCPCELLVIGMWKSRHLLWLLDMYLGV